MSQSSPDYDVLIRGGSIYDGSGAEPATGDVAIRGDAIVAVGQVGTARGRTEIDARGLAVAPGFINMLSWAAESLIADGRAQSDLRQGVTLEVFGEGVSLGPLNAQMQQEMRERQSDITYDVTWTTLDQGLRFLTDRGVSCNVASFVGAATLRIHEIDHADRPPDQATIVAVEPTVVLVAPRSSLLGLIVDRPRLAEVISRASADLFGQEFEELLRRAGDDRPVTTDHDRSFDEHGVGGQGVEHLVAARSGQAELTEKRLPRTGDHERIIGAQQSKNALELGPRRRVF